MNASSASLRCALSACAIFATAAVATAQVPSPVLLVSGGDKDGVRIVDPLVGKMVGTLPTDDDPRSVTISDDGKTAYTANLGPGTISVIDLATRKETRRFEIGKGSEPHDLIFVGGKVYFTAGGYKAVGCYDPATNTLAWLAGTGEYGHMLVLSKDGDKIFATNREGNSIGVVEGVKAGPPKLKVTNVPIGGSPEGIDVSPDGREVWAGKRYGTGISIIDVATLKPTQLDVPFEKPEKIPGRNYVSAGTRVRFTPDGKRVVLLHRATQEVVVFDAASRKEIKRIKVLGDSLLVSPDGARAFVSVEHGATGSGYVDVIDLKSLAVSSRIETAGFANAMAWWPFK